MSPRVLEFNCKAAVYTFWSVGSLMGATNSSPFGRCWSLTWTRKWSLLSQSSYSTSATHHTTTEYRLDHSAAPYHYIASQLRIAMPQPPLHETSNNTLPCFRGMASLKSLAGVEASTNQVSEVTAAPAASNLRVKSCLQPWRKSLRCLSDVSCGRRFRIGPCYKCTIWLQIPAN